MPDWTRKLLTIALGLTSLGAWPALGQVASDSSMVVVPGNQYRAGGLHQFFLGHTYRALWATRIRVPILNLAATAGGMTAVERGGSKQSRSLRFDAGDGRVLVFRALEKDPTQAWPPALRASRARKFAEDQISAILPAGAVAVAVLERAAGLVNPGVSLVVLPDDPRLGQWRQEFASNLGVLEQRLRGSGAAIQDLAGAERVVTSDGLFKRLTDDNRNVVDQRGYLTARLFDLVIGDWDRHGGQWSWARFDDGKIRRWAPLPRDRDWAMARLDGPLYGVLRLYLPKYQTFDPSYGSIYGLTLSAEPLDRRLLGGLERSAWDSVATELMTRLTDGVIAEAVDSLPAEFDRDRVAAIAATLRSRRDALPEAVDRFYRQLAGAVELRGSDNAETVDILAGDDGSLRVSMSGRDSTVVRVDRRFLPRETDELRLYLFGGADRIRWRGGSSPIRVRVIDSAGVAVEGAGPHLSVTDSSRWFRSPVSPNSPNELHRDWGSLYGVIPWFEVQPEQGLLIGGGPVINHYGFERAPYASRLQFRAAYTTGEPGLNLDFTGDFRFRGPAKLLVGAGLLRIDVVRYFGEGNQTIRLDDPEFYDVRQRLYYLEPAVELPLGGAARLAVGAFARASRTDLEHPTLLALNRPYGSGDFTEAGLSAGLTVDTRDQPAYPTRGVQASAGIKFAPGLLDVTHAFAVASARAATFLTAASLPAHPTLALRIGGSHSFGQTPFFEMPTIGGRGSVRGLNSRRFMGETAVFGSAEARLDLGDFSLVLPGEWGLYGLVDAGRVFLAGERSNQWHPAAGGGLWFAFLDRRSTMTLTYARSEERNKIYVQAGFHF